MFYAYVLKSKSDESLYTGFTGDLRKRLIEHNKGNNFATKSKVPWEIIYYEACLNEKDARRIEKYLKTTQGRRLLRRRLKEYFYELPLN